MLRLLEAHGLKAYRNDQRYVGGVENPDIACTLGEVAVHIEVKRVERLNIHTAMQQAIRDANGKALPVVVHRRSREPWLVTLPLEEVLQLIQSR